ncbi:MAG TPA: metallophosphoesterase [Chthoniobacter sp.]|jgi:predicted phosphodiesterase
MLHAVTPIEIPVKQLAWATDLHLGFVVPELLERAIESFAKAPADAFAITGDISDGRYLEHHLSLLAEAIRKPLFLLLGNHDRYHTSFAEAEKLVKRVILNHPQMHRLTGKEVIGLSAKTALLGIDGWADGESGSGSASPVTLNDMIYINDLAKLSRAAQWKQIAKWSRAYTETVRPTLERAMGSFEEVILLTHVPPLPEATWHEGQISGPDFLPHFCNANLGRVIRECCTRHRATRLTVLCGHTHSAGDYEEENLVIHTAGAIYGSPRVDRAISIP